MVGGQPFRPLGRNFFCSARRQAVSGKFILSIIKLFRKKKASMSYGTRILPKQGVRYNKKKIKKNKKLINHQ
jgi:hypothetical protein